MNVLISGATGLIGKSLVKKLKEKNHNVRILSRKSTKGSETFYWNPETGEMDEKALENVDSIIHLAGATIAKRWTKSYKQALYSSRVNTANLLFKNCIKNNIHLKSFISASGINYYGTFTSDKILTEQDVIAHKDFLSDLCVEWEKSAYQFSEISDRIVCLRTAVVLAKEGGSFPILKKITDFNLSSPVGSGKQWMNWIHIDDLVDIYIFALENLDISGNYNAVAEEIPTNADFMKSLSKASNKFFLPMNVPAFFLKLTLGETSSIILEGTRASNQKAKTAGFIFKYKKLSDAFENLIGAKI